MTHTVTLVKQGIAGDLRYTIADVDITSYDATPGEALVPASFGMAVILAVMQMSAAAYLMSYTAATKLLMVYTGGGSHTHTVTAAYGGTGEDYLVNDGGVIKNITTDTAAAVTSGAGSATIAEATGTTDVGPVRLFVLGY